MKEIFEEFGSAIIEICSALVVIGVLWGNFFNHDIFQIIREYVNMIA